MAKGRNLNEDELVEYVSKNGHIFIEITALMRTKKGDIKKSWLTQFWQYGDDDRYTLPKTGGSIEAGVSIRLKDGKEFCLMFLTKDVKGWLKYANDVALAQSLKTAQISGDNLQFSSGETVPLQDCKINGYNLIPTINNF